MTIIKRLLNKINEESELDNMVVFYHISNGLNHSYLACIIQEFISEVNNSFYSRNIDGSTFKIRENNKKLRLGFKPSASNSYYINNNKSVLEATYNGSTITLGGYWNFTDKYFRVDIEVKSAFDNSAFKSGKWTIEKSGNQPATESSGL